MNPFKQWRDQLGAGQGGRRLSKEEQEVSDVSSDQISHLLDDGAHDQSGEETGGHSAEAIDKQPVQPFFHICSAFLLHILL